jgi:predicted nucleic acid-binding protein
MILIDTNVVARTLQKNHIHHRPAMDSILFLRTSQIEILVISPQIIQEFYAIATRASNGLAITPDNALHEIQLIKQDYPLLPESALIYPQWEQLVAKYKPTNRRVFDTKHVAFMLVHRIPKILTFNDQDFLHYSEIQALNPFDVLNIPRV